MSNENHRKSLDDKEWGNFKYDAKDNTLWWKDEDDASWFRNEDGELLVKYDKNSPPHYRLPYPIDDNHDTIPGALHWIAHMAVTKKRYIKEKDLKDLAQFFYELLDCKILPDAYRTSFQNRGEFWRIIRSNNFSVCSQCDKRHMCLTNLPEEMP